MQWILAHFCMKQLVAAAKVELKTCQSDVVFVGAKIRIVFYSLNVSVHYTFLNIYDVRF